MDTNNRQEQEQRVCIQVQPGMSSPVKIYDGNRHKYLYLLVTNQLFSMPFLTSNELENELSYGDNKWHYVKRCQWDKFIKSLKLMSASLESQLLSRYFDLTDAKFVMGGKAYDIGKTYDGLMVVQAISTSLPDDIPCDNMLSDMLKRYSNTIRRTMMAWINEGIVKK